MAEINWTPQALEDIDNIASYIAKDSLHYADLFVERVFEKVTILNHSPRAGRKVPEFNEDSIRELIYGNYRIVYRISGETHLDILTVYHSARLLSNSSLFDN